MQNSAVSTPDALADTQPAPMSIEPGSMLRNEPTKRHLLPILSNSEIRTFRRCAREHHFAYRLRRRPKEKAAALRFGTLLHVALEAWWKCTGNAEARFVAAIEALRASGESDAFDLVKAEELMLGYTARWGEEAYETIAVEEQFDAPLVNPATGAESRTFRLGGKLDAIVRRTHKSLLEHKSTSEDISDGADYWRVVSALDSQVSGYMPGARALGHDVLDCIYDVIRKPGIQQLEATPVENRKYKVMRDKACPECKKKNAPPAPHMIEVGKADSEPGEEASEPRIVECRGGRVVTDPGGQLYANLRDRDETPEEFRLRLREKIGEAPTKYFARGTVVRLEADERDHAFDTWQYARLIREAELEQRFPRNPDACRRYGRFCDYFPVCSGESSIDDDNRFRTAETAHEELAVEEIHTT